MNRFEKLEKRLKEERQRSPELSIRDIARKFNIAEGTVLGVLREGTVSKVKRDRKERILEELREWGSGRVRIYNNWAESEVMCDLGLLEMLKGILILNTEKMLIRIAFSGVETIYFIENERHCELQYFNKRGRCIFGIILPTDPESRIRFHKFRESFCGDEVNPTP